MSRRIQEILDVGGGHTRYVICVCLVLARDFRYTYKLRYCYVIVLFEIGLQNCKALDYALNYIFV